MYSDNNIKNRDKYPFLTLIVKFMQIATNNHSLSDSGIEVEAGH
jgi:hypothetical protein